MCGICTSVCVCKLYINIEGDLVGIISTGMYMGGQTTIKVK